MARVFVTGGTGFIGTELIRRLVERGDQVTCLVRARSSADRSMRIARLREQGVQLLTGDICDPDSIAAPVVAADIVFNVGGVVTARHSQEFFAGNRDGVRNLLDAAATRSSPPVVVHVSSLAAAGVSPRGEPRNENDRCEPVSNYGRSKRAGELVARQFADRVPITVIRPPMVLGQGDLVSLELFKSVANWRLHVVPGRVTREYSLVHVCDLVEVMLRAAERGERLAYCAAEQSSDTSVSRDQAATEYQRVRPLQNPTNRNSENSIQAMWECRSAFSSYDSETPVEGQGVYFASLPGVYTYAELGHLIAEATGRERIKVLRLPDAVLWSAAAASELVAKLRRRPSFINFDKAREASAGHWTCQPGKVERQLGFAARIPVIDRLRETYHWYCEQGWL